MCSVIALTVGRHLDFLQSHASVSSKKSRLLTTALGTSLMAVFFAPDRAAAQVSTSFTVSGDVTAPETFNFATLSALPSITENVTYLSGSGPTTNNKTFTGPSIWNLLTATVGVRTSSVKNDILREVVLATGSPPSPGGLPYQVLYSMGELNPSFGGSSATPPLIADLESTTPATPVPLGSDGFARSTAPSDLYGGRYDSNLSSLYVIHAPTQTGTFSGGISNQLTVTGYVSNPATYSVSSLQALPATSVTVSGSTYTGVNLWTLLTYANVITNPTIKNNILTDYVVATGTDGYQTVISLGEIDPMFGNQPDLVAYYLNGGSLGANGNFRLIVPNDVKQGRWVSNLINLEVFDATIWTANAGEIADLTGLNINANGVILNGGTLTSSLGPGSLTVPTVTLNGGLLDTPVTVNSPNTIVQNSGTNLIAGTLNAPTIAINGGTLQLLNGNLIGATNVASGAVLGGTGNITGALTFAPGSFFAVAVSPTTSDHINVTGTASLAGTVQVTSVNGNPKAGNRYALLTATNGVSGQFSAVSFIGANYFSPTLSYTGNEVDLVLSQKTVASQLTFPVSQNVHAVAIATDAALLSGNAPQSFLNLFNLPTPALPGALQQLTGEAHTGAETAGLHAGSTFLNLLLDPAARDGSESAVASAPALAYADQPPASKGAKAIADAMRSDDKLVLPHLGWTIWGTAFGGVGGASGNSAIGSSRVSNNAEGLLIGADFRPDASFVVGFGLGGGATSYQLGSGLGAGSGGLFQFGTFASKTLGAFYLSASAAYTLNPTQTARTVSAAGSSETLLSNPLGESGGARIELGYHPDGWFGLPITPYVAAEAQRFDTSGASEYAAQGPSDFALNYMPTVTTSVRTELGVRAQTSMLVPAPMVIPSDAVFVTSARLAWAHEYEPLRQATAVFQAAGLTPFSVTGAEPAYNSALVTVGAELRMVNGVTLFAKADADLAPIAYSVRGNIGVNYTW